MVRLKTTGAIAIVLTIALMASAPAFAKYARGIPGRTPSGVHSGQSAGSSPTTGDSFNWGVAETAAVGALAVIAFVLVGVPTVARLRRPGHDSVQTPA
jgi:hypothetical protein